ncbi:MAG: hypothetical protein WBM14_02825 [Terracidiphilus sp.]
MRRNAKHAGPQTGAAMPLDFSLEKQRTDSDWDINKTTEERAWPSALKQ